MSEDFAGPQRLREMIRDMLVAHAEMQRSYRKYRKAEQRGREASGFKEKTDRARADFSQTMERALNFSLKFGIVDRDFKR